MGILNVKKRQSYGQEKERKNEALKIYGYMD